MNRALNIFVRCVGAIMLLALAYLPLGPAAVSAVETPGVDGADTVASADENCDEQVSVDMVTCGSELPGMSQAFADNSYLQMPRERCEEIVNELLSDRICDNGDADCERQRFRRGDLAPTRILARASLALDTHTAGFPPLMRSVGRHLYLDETAMPNSWSAAPPHGPPRVA